MAMTRRQFNIIASAVLLAANRARADENVAKPISLILAPSNLGLRPEEGKKPGTWRAPTSRFTIPTSIRDSNMRAHWSPASPPAFSRTQSS